MALVAIPVLMAPGGEPRPVELTDREWKVARLVAEGHPNKRIAAELHLSARTVENHLSHVYAKLDLGGRSELIVRLLEQRVHYRSDVESAESTAKLVRQRGSEAVVVQGDVCDPEQLRTLVNAAADGLGGLDCYVSNARPELPEFFAGPFDVTVDQWNAAVSSQATAFLLGAREAAGRMADGGRILAVTYATGSVTGGLQPWVAMGAAKAAMESTVRYLAVALAPRRITVNAVSPAWTEDSVLNTLPAEAQDLIREWHQGGWTPMRRLVTPADVGDVAALLVSAEASFVTGQLLRVDGGASLMNAEVPPQLQMPTA